MRQFRIVAVDQNNSSIMTGISIEVPDYMEISEPNPSYGNGVQATSQAVAYVVGRVVEELVRYGASECLLS